MTEKQTSSPESSQFLDQAADAVDLVTQWSQEEKDAADAARRTVGITSAPADPVHIAVSHEAAPAKPELSARVRRNRGNVVAALTLAATVSAIAAADHYANAEPEFSEQTTTFSVPQGRGVSAAAQEIRGLHDMSAGIRHIEADPANIDVLKDGLQQGEQLVIPVSIVGHENDK